MKSYTSEVKKSSDTLTDISLFRSTKMKTIKKNIDWCKERSQQGKIYETNKYFGNFYYSATLDVRLWNTKGKILPSTRSLCKFFKL